MTEVIMAGDSREEREQSNQRHEFVVCLFGVLPGLRSYLALPTVRASINTLLSNTRCQGCQRHE